MTNKKALEVLQVYKDWRTGSEIPMPSPKEITSALEVAIKQLKKSI